MNSQQQGTEPKGVSRPSRGADGLQRQSLETQAAVGVDVPTREGAVGTGPAASRDLWHVLFDGQPRVVCHVCPRHKAIADRLPCDDDKGTNGECAHVQYTACTCIEPERCVACR